MGKNEEPFPVTGYAIIVAVLMVAVLAFFSIYFALFKPKDPRIKVEGILLDSMASGSGIPLANTLFSLTLTLYVSVENPNRASFHYSNLGVYLYYSGREIGFVQVSADQLPAKSTRKFVAYLTGNEASGFMSNPALQTTSASGVISVAVKVAMSGYVTVLNSFTHHANPASICTVSISATLHDILVYNCERSS